VFFHDFDSHFPCSFVIVIAFIRIHQLYFIVQLRQSAIFAL